MLILRFGLLFSNLSIAVIFLSGISLQKACCHGTLFTTYTRSHLTNISISVSIHSSGNTSDSVSVSGSNINSGVFSNVSISGSGIIINIIDSSLSSCTSTTFSIRDISNCEMRSVIMISMVVRQCSFLLVNKNIQPKVAMFWKVAVSDGITLGRTLKF